MAEKQVFNIPYIGIDHSSGLDILVGSGGECSVIIQINNPVTRFSAATAAYDEFHALMINIVKILGDGYLLQKSDVISKEKYPLKQSDEYLQQKYNAHFEGREYIKVNTYITLTKQVRKGAFYVFDKKVLRDFSQQLDKVMDILIAGKTGASILKEQQLNLLVMQFLAMDFKAGPIALNNLSPDDTEIKMGDRAIRNIPLINIDNVDLPPSVSTHIEMNEKETLRGFPVDFLSFLFRVPDFEVIIFNQVIDIPSQFMTLKKLELKKKRHSGIPDPANMLCVEDIDLLLNDVARENQLLVNCHFNIVLAAKQEKIQRAANFIESALFSLGIIASKNGYNQLELFRCALPGNAVELKDYDWFLTTCDAAICFFLKESMPLDEPSDFLVRFTDRQGIPVGIDVADLPMRTNRINNRNKFVLGPSGSGKSFFMNSLIEQYMLYNMDMVIVDTGHSYSGLCSYYKGKYITYTDKKPITMNPFQIKAEEFNIEKRDFLSTLVGLLWKGADGTFTQVERDVISNVIGAYYLQYFEQGEAPVESESDLMPGKSPVIKELNFNSFYEFALWKIPEIKQEERIPFDIDEFRYVLKKFYKGAEFAAILNEPADASLFTERFIVFEIDAVKENRVLFPIVTLIIMDVFIQKMRFRSARRKALVVEEAWKAIASPLMAGYLLYLYKTVRKFWGEAIVVTQELGDIIGNAVVKDSILNNSDTICLLDQTKFKDNYGAIASLLSINETERKKIFSINQLENTDGRGRFKEVYIRRGSFGEVYGVEVSLHQYITFSTEKPEKSALEVYIERFGSYHRALDLFVNDFHTSKLTLSQFVSHINQHGQPYLYDNHENDNAFPYRPATINF
ncbi:TraG family conjugative transposon ATPase [Mucilaginibacter rubeus]|uniref:TraG family conjugative transposon ATPase n=1 Tax=Mucilaginibacter rubeus TaxID=2027860 RepID=A0AAE6JFS7_9SPHI|nr:MULTISPECIES: TraG family conjugative transposon ATPase [Mucilaginibacter]QEM04944.1 TraG family conjugative transposon ATPase [Mucilaginibacter rubeus]QEM17538.1 TraG family conjugative transposon ATPase [Mucilaginibacter gossypii]QTE45941.1 TraG family conjugative transposon ATPase [Mucilaginibacter rubeus]QTE52538.1 TraG family conjugative transposon ATPase [Mucilaginibacter rubeus]QTE57627.1 TraG family conjugative transposon ATPase [Mucilaginibacter rubeus]